ncbi:AfsA-related hotdog domain-containing protein [Streptacidiphilus albus]|uniref:AfsA-related hotdog domain-containing protein n=1 Tax=Streptacidiphilus albus TaxID=105425 RepID=UPI000690E914|nr:AfsA-related hotdog domain-containing protein [Streptacidiphilus albus]
MTLTTLPPDTDARPLDAAAPDLATQRTVSRHLVHRAALAEVFLTDFRSVDEETFHAAAQLPAGHAYYGDHTGTPAMHDPLAVFEGVRQMLLCAMHLQHDADRATKSITATARMEITDPGPLQVTGPLDLVLLGSVLLAKEYQGKISRVVHQVRVMAGGSQVGTVTVDTAQRPDAVYRKLRLGHRTTLPPYSDSVAPHGDGAPPAPHLVGRERSANVVVQDMRVQDDGAVARLRVPVTHPSMFDHPQDHVPGPVMMEAARQAVLFAAAEHLGLAAPKLFLQRVDASYLRFAELDSDITVRVGPTGGHGPGAVGAKVDFEQDGTTVATLHVVLGSTRVPRPATGEAGDAV